MNLLKTVFLCFLAVLTIWIGLFADSRINGLRKRKPQKKSTLQIAGQKKVAPKVVIQKSIPVDEDSAAVHDEDATDDEDTITQSVTLIPKKAAGYYGEMKNNLPDGKGLMIYQNGERYEGGWRGGERHGYGIFWFATGQKYSGMWAQGKMDGEGAYMLPDGSQYYGEMKQNAISGKGECHYRDGSLYSGEWIEGKWQGCGVYSLPDGRSVTAFFLKQQVIRQFESVDACQQWRNGGSDGNEKGDDDVR